MPKKTRRNRNVSGRCLTAVQKGEPYNPLFTVVGDDGLVTVSNSSAVRACLLTKTKKYL